TVAAQIVASELGLDPASIDVVPDLAPRAGSWSVASGNYSNRFASIVVEAIVGCARKVADKLKGLAAAELGASKDAIELVEGMARVAGDPTRSISFRKLVARPHWHPTSLPEEVTPGIYETAMWSPPSLTEITADDRVRSALTFGF